MRSNFRKPEGARRRTKARRTVAPEDQFTATDFFERVVPAMIAKNRMAYQRHRGTICFWVYEVGSWTIRFGEKDVGRAVTAETNFGADLVAGFKKDTFARFLAGEEIEPDKGCYFEGDVSLLGRLGRLLEMPQGMVALRAANM